jgi:hypothetical protein
MTAILDYYRSITGMREEVSCYYPQGFPLGQQIASKLFNMILFNCPETNQLSVIYSQRLLDSQTVATDVGHLDRQFSYINSSIQKEMYNNWHISTRNNISLQTFPHNTIVSLESLIEKSFTKLSKFCDNAEARNVITRQLGVFVCNILDVNDNVHNVFITTACNMEYSLDIPEFNKMVHRNGIAYRHITITLTGNDGEFIRNHLVTHVWRKEYTWLQHT